MIITLKKFVMAAKQFSDMDWVTQALLEDIVSGTSVEGQNWNLNSLRLIRKLLVILGQSGNEEASELARDIEEELMKKCDCRITEPAGGQLEIEYCLTHDFAETTALERDHLRAITADLLAALRELADDIHILGEGYLHGPLSKTETMAVRSKAKAMEDKARAAIAGMEETA